MVFGFGRLLGHFELEQGLVIVVVPCLFRSIDSTIEPFMQRVQGR